MLALYLQGKRNVVTSAPTELLNDPRLSITKGARATYYMFILTMSSTKRPRLALQVVREESAMNTCMKAVSDHWIMRVEILGFSRTGMAKPI
jgi:hypothetical protein